MQKSFRTFETPDGSRKTGLVDVTVDLAKRIHLGGWIFMLHARAKMTAFSGRVGACDTAEGDTFFVMQNRADGCISENMASEFRGRSKSEIDVVSTAVREGEML